MSYIKEESPDILCVQETKCEEKKLPPGVLDKDYHIFWSPAEKAGYAGTGLYSKKKPIKVTYGLGKSKCTKVHKCQVLESCNFMQLHWNPWMWPLDYIGTCKWVQVNWNLAQCTDPRENLLKVTGKCIKGWHLIQVSAIVLRAKKVTCELGKCTYTNVLEIEVLTTGTCEWVQECLCDLWITSTKVHVYIRTDALKCSKVSL